MIDHLSITTSDLDRAQAFYDAVLGAARLSAGQPPRERAIGYGERDHGPDGAPCYISIYLCTATSCPTTGTGASARRAAPPCAPSIRPPLPMAAPTTDRRASARDYSPDYYAAFVRDPDGNRLEAVTRRPEE